MGDVSDDLNKHCSVLSDAGMEVKGTKDIVQECLRQFPYIWASFDSFNLWYMSHERV